MKQRKSNTDFSLEKVVERSKQISRIREGILSSADSASLTHKIVFEKPMKVTGLHTSNICESVYADYNYGSLVRGYDINTGECIFSLEWNPHPTKLFKGFSNCPSFLLAISDEEGKFKAFDLNLKGSLYAQIEACKGISEMVLTPDKDIIIACLDGCAYVYRSSDWTLYRVLCYPPISPITSLALVPYSTLILLGYQDGNVAILDYVNGRVPGSFKLSEEPIKSISSSKEQFAASTDNDLFLCDLKKGVTHIIHYDTKIKLVKIGIGDCWSHSPTLLNLNRITESWMESEVFIGLESGLISIVNLSGYGLVSEIHGHKDEINSLLVSPGHYLISGSSDGSIRRTQIPSSKCVNIYYQTDGNRSVAVSSNGKYLSVSGIVDDRAKLIDLSSGTIKQTFEHQNSVRAVQFAKVDGHEYLFTGGWDGMVYQWNIEDGRLMNEFSAPGYVDDVKIHNNLLAVAYYARQQYGAFRIWDLTKNKIIYDCKGHDPYVDPGQSVYLHLDSDFIFSSGDDGMIYKWRLADNSLMQSFSHGSSVRCIAISSNRRLLFSAATDCTIKVWDIFTGIKIKTLFGNSGRVYFIVLSNEDKYLFSANEYGAINKFDVHSGKLLQTFNYHNGLRIWQIKLSPDGKTLITASEDGTVKFISAFNGELLGTYYNTEKGFLWSTPSTKQTPNEYYWTDRLDLVEVSEENFDSNNHCSTLDEKRIHEYHSVYNNQKLVMSKLNSSKFSDLYKLSSLQMKNELLINRLIDTNQNKLLNSGV
jgi:WD40 repeat protein